MIILVAVWCAHSTVAAKEVTDQAGRKIVFTTPFNRIISLYGAHTENLYYLGAADLIAGVSVNDTFPEQVKKKQKFSYHDGPEKFLGARPDLVIIRPMIDNGYPRLIQQLERTGITVVSLQPSNIEQMYEYWKKLGVLTGRQVMAERMILDFQRQIETLSAATRQIEHKKRVYFQSIHSKMKTFTPSAMPIFALTTAGGINVAADAKASRQSNIANYGKERILAKADQIDLFLAQVGKMNAVNKEMIKNEPGFNIIKAIKNDQIYLIDERIVSRPVPRLLDGIRTIGTILYPDLFITLWSEKEES